MILKSTEASKYIGVSINTIKTLANNGKIKSLRRVGEMRTDEMDTLERYGIADTIYY